MDIRPLQQLLYLAIKHKASDLHLSSGLPPIFRINGDLCQLDQTVIEHEEIAKMIDSVMNDMQRKAYIKYLEADFSFEFSPSERFRANVYTQANGCAAVFRIIPGTILTMHDLQLPSVFRTIACLSQGLVLVTGPLQPSSTTLIQHVVSTSLH